MVTTQRKSYWLRSPTPSGRVANKHERTGHCRGVRNSRDRAIGEEMQRRLPKPSRRVPRLLHPDEPVSEKRELTQGAAEGVESFGVVGALAAVPGALLAWLHHRRR